MRHKLIPKEYYKKLLSPRAYTLIIQIDEYNRSEIPWNAKWLLITRLSHIFFYTKNEEEAQKELNERKERSFCWVVTFLIFFPLQQKMAEIKLLPHIMSIIIAVRQKSQSYIIFLKSIFHSPTIHIQLLYIFNVVIVVDYNRACT